ncbi:glutathione S-transferase family protein [Aliikangiella sp. IMCC44359]|uniref:glutathione S-transferase family protein n=1 Tax=Aliikangiella sp. IMCC44359 TaxID=3459125 RepID=UPI00403A7D76
MENSAVKEKEYLLVSFSICPYVQKVAFCMQQLGVDYKLRYINPYKEKPDWFVDVSPAGKVPVLVVVEKDNEIKDQKVLFESSVILEYLNDVSNNRFMPDDSYEKAIYRIKLKSVESLQSQLGGLFSQESEGLFSEKADLIRCSINDFESNIVDILSDEKENAGLLTFASAPFFFVIRLIEQITDYEILSSKSLIGKFANQIISSDTFKQTICESYYSDLASFFSAKKSFLSERTERFTASDNWEKQLSLLVE